VYGAPGVCDDVYRSVVVRLGVFDVMDERGIVIVWWRVDVVVVVSLMILGSYTFTNDVHKSRKIQAFFCLLLPLRVVTPACYNC
jgi:hypothetical protein